MLPADKCILLYRESLKEWEANGWRIDQEAVDAAKNRVSYAIPSPARHKQKGWVMDAIPLRPASKQADLKAAS
jgi:predicted pyridoxine 5'-phosphate oxidase superfamily flavin-nucleotide-binding protein